MRAPNGARRHPRLQREGPGCSRCQILAPQKNPRRLRRGECRSSQRDAPPLPEGEFGYDTSLWTLEMAAQASFEEGLTHRRVSGETIRSRSEEHTSEIQSRQYIVCPPLLVKKKKQYDY